MFLLITLSISAAIRMSSASLRKYVYEHPGHNPEDVLLYEKFDEIEEWGLDTLYTPKVGREKAIEFLMDFEENRDYIESIEHNEYLNRRKYKECERDEHIARIKDDTGEEYECKIDQNAYSVQRLIDALQQIVKENPVAARYKVQREWEWFVDDIVVDDERQYVHLRSY